MRNPICLFSESSGIRIVWGVYGKCSLNCKHCSVTKEDYKNPEIEKYEPTLKDMKSSGVDTIYISGGEPLLWKDIFDFIKLVKENGIMATLGTNGTELNQRNVEKLSEIGIDKIFLSLDSHKEEFHNFLRGRDVFRRTLNGLKLLNEHKIYTRIDCVLWKENYKNIEEFVNFCKDNGAEEIAFAWPMKIGNAATNPDILIPESEYLETGRRLKSLKEKYSEINISYHRFESFDSRCQGCNGGRKIFYLDWRGHLSPCFWISALNPEFFTKDSIFENKFSKLKESEMIKGFIQIEERRKEKFGSGCPAICKIYNGNFSSKDSLLL
jgi:MoaA/NifB/PqqE/SkfB family radical SAM enzyme